MASAAAGEHVGILGAELSYTIVRIKVDMSLKPSATAAAAPPPGLVLTTYLAPTTIVRLVFEPTMLVV